MHTYPPLFLHFPCRADASEQCAHRKKNCLLSNYNLHKMETFVLFRGGKRVILKIDDMHIDRIAHIFQVCSKLLIC